MQGCGNRICVDGKTPSDTDKELVSLMENDTESYGNKSGDDTTCSHIEV